jgi:hypothetical protein
MPARRVTYPTQSVVDALLAASTFLYAGDKKYVRNLNVTLSAIPTVNLADLGYTDAKWRQLFKNYWNSDDVERVRSMLATRKGMQVTSVALSMRGGDKGAHSQGWCMESMVITSTPRETHVTVFYRTSEVVKKLAADFAFLRHLFDHLRITPASVHLHFAIAWLGMTYAPLLLRSCSAEAFLESLKSDRVMWMSATNTLARYLDASRKPKYSAEIRQHRYFHSRWSEERKHTLREYLTAKGRMFSAENP